MKRSLSAEQSGSEQLRRALINWGEWELSEKKKYCELQRPEGYSWDNKEYLLPFERLSPDLILTLIDTVNTTGSGFRAIKATKKSESMREQERPGRFFKWLIKLWHSMNHRDEKYRYKSRIVAIVNDAGNRVTSRVIVWERISE